MNRTFLSFCAKNRKTNTELLVESSSTNLFSLSLSLYNSKEKRSKPLRYLFDCIVSVSAFVSIIFHVPSWCTMLSRCWSVRSHKFLNPNARGFLVRVYSLARLALQVDTPLTVNFGLALIIPLSHECFLFSISGDPEGGCWRVDSDSRGDDRQ